MRRTARLLLARTLLLGVAFQTLAPAASADDGDLAEIVTIGDGVGGLEATLEDEDAFGECFADLGDLDGDGLVEVAVGALTDDDGGPGRGAVYILSLAEDGTVRRTKKISSTEGNFQGTLNDIDLFGSAVTCPGDLDGDGVADLVVGAYGDDTGGSGRGAIWILLLNADGTVHGQTKVASGVGGFSGPLQDGDFFGLSLATLGDLDGDGTVEIAVGSPGADTGGSRTGGVWILSITASGAVGSQAIDDANGGFGGNLASGDYFGNSVAGLGDLDGDGVPDMAVGASEAEGAVGNVWILFLNPDGTVRSPVRLGASTEPLLAAALEPSDRIGVGLAAIGDLDGDGTVDLAASAWGLSDVQSAVGGIVLLFLQPDGRPTSIRTHSDSDRLLAPHLEPNIRFGRGLGFVQATPEPWLFCSADDLLPTNGADNRGAAHGLRLCRGDLQAAFGATNTSGDVPLAVQFTDASSGTGLTSWDWDFGDGGSSSEASPTYVYQLPGTYDVVLRVSGPGGYCARTEFELVVATSTDLVTPRNGSGINPDVYRELNLPLLGTTWQSRIDGTGQGWTGLTFLLVYPLPLLGAPTPLGELLVDVTSGLQASHISFFLGPTAVHSIPIPNDPALLGTRFSAQTLVNGPGLLTNALDIVLGE